MRERNFLIGIFFGDLLRVFLKAGLIFLLMAGCKNESSESDTETLKSSTFDWRSMRASNLYLYFWPTRIVAAKNQLELCWYYKEIPQSVKKMKLIDGLRTSVRLNPRSLPLAFVHQRLNESIALHTVNLGLSQWGAAKSCSEAVVGTTIITTMPALTGAVIGPTAGQALACALGISGLVTSSQAIERNTNAHIALPAAGLSSKLPVGVKADVLKRIKEAVEQAEERDYSVTSETCPKSETLIQGLLKNNLKFPDVPL